MLFPYVLVVTATKVQRLLMLHSKHHRTILRETFSILEHDDLYFRKL